MSFYFCTFAAEMKTIRFILSVLCIAAGLYAHAEAYTIETIPSPKEEGQHFYVSNPDGVLSAETESYLNEIATNLDKSTEVEMAIVAINTWDEHEYSSTYGFAVRLFNYWGIGKADKNTGVLVLLAVEDRDIQIITGKGIEGILTDAECGYILDDNLSYLSDNDWDGGMSHICNDIANYLMEDENRSELLLGWHPASTEDGWLLAGYFMLGFIIMIVLALVTYKKWQGEPGQSGPEIRKKGDDVQGCAGCLMFIFPIPLLFYYIYHRIAGRHLQTIPIVCKKCGTTMVMIPKDQLTPLLTKQQQTEQKLDARTFDKWHCPQCGEEELLIHKGIYYTRYNECPECNARTGKLIRNTVIKRPSYDHTGEQKNLYKCECCGKEWDSIVTLRKLERSYSSSSSSSSSWGGGGGSSRSSGSWGGGSSSGGGAGRHF